MTSDIFLIGGGPGAIMSTRKLLKQALATLGPKAKKTKTRLAYVGAASNDNVGFQKMLSGLFLGTGASLESVKLARKNASVATAKRVLEECDAVFMSGGDVEHGMRILDERGVSDHFRKLAKQGKPFIGISAGSIMTGLGWVRFPDEGDEARAEPFPCLGIAPVYMDAHSEEDDWSELRVLMQLLGKKHPDVVGYGVPSKGCLHVELGGAAPKLRALGYAVARIGVKKDRAPLLPT
jgi:cyanophycinase-like exopeptidase